MTIKKRLAISNIIMLVVPVCVTGLMAMACMLLMWAFVVNGSGLSFADSEDFYHACKGMAALVGEALEGDRKSQLNNLGELARALEENSMSVEVFEAGEEDAFYSCGASAANDAALMSAVEAMGGEGLVSAGGRSLYVKAITADGCEYEVRLYGSEHEFSYRSLKLAVSFAGVVLLFTIVAAVWLTNRFLTRFVISKIEAPLDILSEGAREIGSGNLDYRISYNEADEFAPVCGQFNDMAARLKASVEQEQLHEESRKELMASLSHDLRSPLTAILAYVDGLLDGVAATPEKQHDYLLTIRAKAEQLRDMVSQIFLYSKLELEAFPVNCSAVRLDEEAAALLGNELGADYAARGVSIDTSGLEPAPAFADPALLRRCVTNIIDNSAKYCPAPVQVRVSTSQCEGCARLIIEDNGPGVPEEKLDKLFDIFYRSDPARTSPAQGSGLGLAIVARAVQRMGGHVSARNAAPHGLCIEITLPKEEPEHE